MLTELERIPDSESSHQHTRKRKKKPRPSPIALEPCAGARGNAPNSEHFLNIVCYAGNRAAVLTLLVRMPTGGSSYAPPGVPGDYPSTDNHPSHNFSRNIRLELNNLQLLGIALASSLVTLGNPRKASVDPTQKVVVRRICTIAHLDNHFDEIYSHSSLSRWSRQILIQNCEKVER